MVLLLERSIEVSQCPLSRFRYMVLNIHSDASFEPSCRILLPRLNIYSNQPITKPNLAPSSSTAAEGKIIRLILEELGHPQPATPVHCDYATAAGIANNSIKKQRSRAMEMRFFWVADQVQRKLFDVHWYPGKENLADYFTKHFDAKHHIAVRPYYLHMPNSPQFLPRAAAPPSSSWRSVWSPSSVHGPRARVPGRSQKSSRDDRQTKNVGTVLQ
jgi:hypothetical protein